ncbi:MAG: hypothetical protein JNM27_13250 [Leptospirales bacterium]|nr:hypothetical protein [Leptospirales bacterium]
MDKKENQPLEIEELDLSLPDDLNLDLEGELPLPEATATGMDDLDLDLPPLTEDDDSLHTDLSSASDDPFATSGASHSEPGMPAATEDNFSMASDLDDDEPIALSEEELERIVGSTESDIFQDMPDHGIEPEFQSPATEMEDDAATDLDSAASMDHSADSDFGDLGSPDFGEMPTDLEDDGPVSLSEEELGNIMGDVHEVSDSHAEAAQMPVESSFDQTDLDVAPAMSLADDDEEDNITLSDDELNNILLDSSDLEGARAESSAPPLSEMGLDDDDEPIALSPEELGNIISDVEVESAGVGEDMEMAAASSLLDEEDDGPVALSDSELDSILEDVSEETEADVGMAAAPGSSANLIVLDEYEDREKSEEAQKRDMALDSIADEQGIQKQELKKMISYLDQLFDKLPEDTVREFSHSEYFDLYKKIMQDLGLT